MFFDSARVALHDFLFKMFLVSLKLGLGAAPSFICLKKSHLSRFKFVASPRDHIRDAPPLVFNVSFPLLIGVMTELTSPSCPGVWHADAVSLY